MSSSLLLRLNKRFCFSFNQKCVAGFLNLTNLYLLKCLGHIFRGMRFSNYLKTKENYYYFGPLLKYFRTGGEAIKNSVKISNYYGIKIAKYELETTDIFKVSRNVEI